MKHGHNIGIATTYRTLNLLSEAGLAEQKTFNDTNTTVYEPRFPDRHHDHIICNKCGLIIEFEDKDIEKQQKRIAKKHGFELTDHTLYLYGLCKDCQKAY